MQHHRRSFRYALGFTFSLALVSARFASALSLSDLAGGASFSTGSLTFSSFDVSLSGSLPADLSNYPVQVLGDGFRVGGPLSAVFGETGTLLLAFDVVTTQLDGFVGASLFADGTVLGTGALAFVASALFGEGGGGLGTLVAFELAGAGGPPSDQVVLAGPNGLHAVTSIQLRSGILAALPFVEQRFLTVPDARPLMLLLTGLGGLAVFGRRRDA